MAEMNRVVIKCYFKPGLSATETLVLVQKAYVNEAVNRSNVLRWYSRFRDGKKLVEVDEGGDRPKSTGTKVNVAAVVADLVKNDRRIVSGMIAECLKEDSALEIFSCCTIMRPPTELQVFAQFLTQKILQPFITLRALHIYLR
jgi:hypothetical protein